MEIGKIYLKLFRLLFCKMPLLNIHLLFYFLSLFLFFLYLVYMFLFYLFYFFLHFLPGSSNLKDLKEFIQKNSEVKTDIEHLKKEVEAFCTKFSMPGNKYWICIVLVFCVSIHKIQVQCKFFIGKINLLLVNKYKLDEI